MSIHVTTDTVANDRTFSRATTFDVDDRGYLRIWHNSHMVAIFSPTAWLSASDET